MTTTLTVEQLNSVVFFLGLPTTADNFTLIDNVNLTLSPESSPRILATVTALESIETQIATARNLGSPLPYNQLRIEGQRLVKQLSSCFGIELRQNIYD
jgi:hypothetical protein